MSRQSTGCSTDKPKRTTKVGLHGVGFDVLLDRLRTGHFGDDVTILSRVKLV